MKRYSLLLACFAATGAQALDNCKFQRQIEESLDVSDSRELAVTAAAGDLEITGVDGLDEVRIRATVCASEEEWAQDSRVESAGGVQAEVATVMPEIDWDLFRTGRQYLYMDLDLEVPADLLLRIRDSSGDIDVRGVAGASIKDSSGDIEIEDVLGDLVLEDSSGDINIDGVDGNVTVEADSSGDIYGDDIQGSVLVARDSSGDIRFKQVRDDFVVERDSSGDIAARSIGGDFKVLKDGSGEIYSENVDGAVHLPDKN